MKEGDEFSKSQREFNMPGHGAGLLTNVEISSVISSFRSPSHPRVGRRLVECCCLGLPMKSLESRFR